jgi:uncharacterized protein YkwD
MYDGRTPEDSEHVSGPSSPSGGHLSPPGGSTRPAAGVASGPERTPGRRPGAVRLVAIILPVLMVVAGLVTAVSVATQGRAVAAGTTDIGQVESLYAQDLVARINAERAARSTGASPIPQLQLDGSLQAYAQAWSAHIAATGSVADPQLPSCTATTAGVCALAANSGNTGYGYWPGDGSDGMDAEYMQSTWHRQNELGAGYTSVGVGVTCADDQAWTVEVFGYAYSDYPSANARQVAQDDHQGQPVAPSPMVAGTQTGDPVYCPGQTVGPGNQLTATGGQFAYPFAVAAVPGEPNGTSASPAVGVAATPDGNGYWVARANGSVTAHGDAANDGSMAGTPLVAPITHVVATSDGKGYWLVASDGGIFSFGDARFFGSMGGKRLNAPVVDLAPTADDNGYWLVASDGGVFAFGDARFQGSMGGHRLNAPLVAMATDVATGGYWLVASDGGVFAFGAPFRGSTGGKPLNRPVNGMAATPGGGGYWFVSSDGGIFAFGNAQFHGSTGGVRLNAPVVGMAADPAGGGYWLVGADGGIFTFGGAPFLGAG